MSAIFDCCIINDELDMLELRMELLYDHVDYFVVCEADLTHSGRVKPLHLKTNLSRFEKFKDKLIPIVATLNPMTNSWERERSHRHSIVDGLIGVAEPNDLIIVGDVDEICRPEIIAAIDRERGARLELNMYYYNLHTRVKQGWSIGALPFGMEADPNKIRSLEGHNPPVIDNAGWHLSYMMTPEGIVNKIGSFLHHDWSETDPRVLDVDFVKERVESGKDVWSRPGMELVQDMTYAGLPDTLFADSKWQHWW